MTMTWNTDGLPGQSPTAIIIPQKRRRRGKAVSLRTVAQSAGVSVATVSLVLNHHPRISAPTRKRVQRAIERMGYKPKSTSNGAARTGVTTLAVLLPPMRHAFADVYFGELISGINDRATKLGYQVLFEQAKPDFLSAGKHVELIQRGAAAGMLLVGFNERYEFLADFARENLSAVMVDNCSQGWELDCVTSDYRSGTQQMMSYLTQLGHRRIGLITGSFQSRGSCELINTYKSELAAVGHTTDDTWFADGRFTEEGGSGAAELLLSRHPNLTAIFAGNDKMAIGAMHTLSEKGLRVPVDISLAGFGNLRHAAFLNPPLTTVHTPLFMVGTQACERLVERIKGRTEPVTDRISTHLIIRDSTALARA
jgi:LacI family transcriptional regulator